MGGRPEANAQPAPAPCPSDQPVVLVVAHDLLFGSRIARAAAALGVRTIAVRERSELPRLVAAHRPRALLVDLSLGWDWATVLSAARAAAPESLHILAFGPHRQRDVLRAARAAGCDRVVTNATLATALPQLLTTAVGSAQRSGRAAGD